MTAQAPPPTITVAGLGLPALNPGAVMSATTATASTASAAATGQGGATTVQVWTLILAALAVSATLVSAWLLRRTGRGTVEAAQRAAAASERSSLASEKSAEAAQEAVGVNRETAASVALRAEADAFAKRYHDAAAQLGHDQAPVRLAGAYAMARLADDWVQHRQECVDVLCAYLRMAWLSSVDRSDASEPTDPPESEVRRTIVDLISAHVRRDAPHSWSDLTFNLRSAKLPHLRLADAHFKKLLVLSDAEFLEGVEIRNTAFDSGATFARAYFSSGLQMYNIETHLSVAFDDCIVPIMEDAKLLLTYVDRIASISFAGHSAGRFHVILQASEEPQGPIVLRKLYGIPADGSHLMRIVKHTVNAQPGLRQEYPAVARFAQPDEYAQAVDIDDGIDIIEYGP